MAAQRICSIQDCGKVIYARGLCPKHYKKAHRESPELLAPVAKPKVGCLIPGCDEPYRCSGLCSKHYARHCRNKWTNDPNRERCAVDGCTKAKIKGPHCDAHHWLFVSNGDPLKRRAAPRGAQIEFVERLLASPKTDECIPWPFGKSSQKNRYGAIQIDGRTESAPRYVCLRKHGAPPTPQHQVCHSCRYMPCVNPEHLRWGTPKENGEDKVLHGSSCRGEQQHDAKLTAADVLAIRAEPASVTTAELARRYGVSEPAIYSVRKGRTWKHLQAALP